MFVIELAGINILIDNKYEYAEKLCRNYISKKEPDFKVKVTEAEIAKESLASDLDNSEGKYNGYLESICIYRQIAVKLPEYDAFLMHAAVVETDGYAYAFAAKSGTGKTTHIRMWHRLLGDRMNVINGDKPIMRFFGGELYACGTPWSGKEMMNNNTKAPLKGICFIYRAQNNTISKINVKEAIERIANQIIIPKNPYAASMTLELISKTLINTPVWSLGCNISVDAARVSYEAMVKGK